MRRLLVNDALNQLGERTFWNLLKEWFSMEECTGDYATLAQEAADAIEFFNPDDGYAGDEPGYSLVVRNATWFPPIVVRDRMQTPTISLLQDIFESGPQREMQQRVMTTSDVVVFNSAFTASKYDAKETDRVIPLPVDFSLFTPQNVMGCQQALSLPDGCVCWIGASQGAAGHVKGFDTFRQVARTNPDILFVAVFKDALPESLPPNVRGYARLPQDELVRVIGACRVGLCTSRTESQHLAGVEMGACGLPLVTSDVGVYWKGGRFGLTVVYEPSPQEFAAGIRAWLSGQRPGEPIREHWQREFDLPVVRAQWESLVKEIENEAV